MIRIRFQDAAAEQRGLGFLAGRFSFRSFADGQTLLPPAALSALAVQGIPFTVEGPATYERSIPAVRNSSAPAVQ